MATRNLVAWADWEKSMFRKPDCIVTATATWVSTGMLRLQFSSCTRTVWHRPCWLIPFICNMKIREDAPGNKAITMNFFTIAKDMFHTLSSIDLHQWVRQGRMNRREGEGREPGVGVGGM